MWVRSQNKLYLLDVDNLYIEQASEVVGGKITTGYFIRHDNRRYIFLMGIYSTEEKAKQVLDMVQKYISGKSNYYIVRDKRNENGYEVLNDMYISRQHCRNGIFQMPKDSEVEV